MATATEIATRSLRRLGVIDSLENPAGADVTAATEALTAMLASWEAEGLSDEATPLDGRFEQGVVALLAVRLAEEYGKTPGPILMRDAKQGWDALLAAFHVVKPHTFDAALQTGCYGYRTLDTSEAGDYEEWQESTEYALRTRAYLNGNLYEVTTAGTSGSTGPTGTGHGITDGTVTWVWRRTVQG